ncbi:MAG TPA: bacteriohemerythrin [Candidatus Kapabacteria bacterium]|nr:bacteriohemerythrin [Candidatus Kapabacteria bacterium]
MCNLEWQSNFELGDDNVDNQHKKLIKLMNTLCESFENKADKAETNNALDDLVFYTKIHNNTEEKLMEELNYNGLELQRNSNRNFYTLISDFRDSFQSGDNSKEYDFLAAIKSWLSNHLSVEHKKYSI